MDLIKTLKAFKNKQVLVLIISLIGTSIYFQTIGFAFTIDDGMYSFNNFVTQEGLNRIPDLFKYGGMAVDDSQYATKSGTYRPVTLFSFALEYHIFGEFKPAVGHILNVLLYLLVNIVLGFCLLLLFQRKTNNYFIPLIILLLWSLHPLHVEVVASIKSRDTLLSAFFSFVAILLWIRQMNKNTARTTRGTGGKTIGKTTSNWQKYVNPVLVGFLFLLGLLSKEESLPLIAVAVFSGYYFFNFTIADSIKKAIPFILAGIVYLAARSIILDPSPDIFNSILNNVIFGAEGSSRMATNLYIYLYYIRLLFFPHPLSWDYSYSQVAIKSISDPSVMLSFTFFILLLLYGLYSMKNRNMIGFGILFYLSTFSIFSNISESITIGATIGERFMFIPSAGFSIVVVCGLFSIVQRLNVRRQNLIGLLILSPVLIFFSLKSYSYTQAWQNNFIIKEHGAKAAPNSWRTQIYYGDELRRQANALKIQYRVESSKADSVKKLYTKAIRHYEIGFSILQNRPERPGLYYMGLGECYLNIGDTTSAVNAFQTQIQFNPGAYDPKLALGIISYNKKAYLDALSYFEQARQANAPDLISIYRHLGITHMRMGNNDQAIEAFETALNHGTIQPEEADRFTLYSLIGASYFYQNNLDKAVENYEKAMQYGSSNEVINILIAMWRAKGDMDKVAHYQGLLSNN